MRKDELKKKISALNDEEKMEIIRNYVEPEVSDEEIMQIYNSASNDQINRFHRLAVERRMTDEEVVAAFDTLNLKTKATIVRQAIEPRMTDLQVEEAFMRLSVDEKNDRLRKVIYPPMSEEELEDIYSNMSKEEKLDMYSKALSSKKEELEDLSKFVNLGLKYSKNLTGDPYNNIPLYNVYVAFFEEGDFTICMDYIDKNNNYLLRDLYSDNISPKYIDALENGKTNLFGSEACLIRLWDIIDKNMLGKPYIGNETINRIKDIITDYLVVNPTFYSSIVKSDEKKAYVR
ncbi:MAG: hypothetical protein IJ565_03300 [Bacilli bacterium]|nr:hypothetical protein [Bacilli bacterium]